LNLLNNIPGQATAKKIIRGSLIRNRLASTYLFYGDDGIGKWAMALALTALVNCENLTEADSFELLDACGECRSCRQIANFNFGELLFAIPLTPHKNEKEAIDITLDYLKQKKEEPYSIISSTRQMTIPVSSAREMKRRTAIRPPKGAKRVILFYQMERMLTASADSLLKLIEEPPPETIIILTAGSPSNLLPTIQSRSQKIRFKPLSESDTSNYLISKYDVSAERAEFISRLANGSIGRALEFLNNESKDSVRKTAFLLFKELFFKDNPSAVALLNGMISPNNRGENEQILAHWQSFLADLIVLKYGNSAESIKSIDLRSELEQLISGLQSQDDIVNMSQEIKKTLIGLRRNIHARPALSSLVLALRKYINQSA